METPEATAAFVAASLGNLVAMARRHSELAVLVYLIEIAKIEALKRSNQ